MGRFIGYEGTLPQPLANESAAAVVEPGTIIMDQETGKEYKYVQLDTGTGPVATALYKLAYYTDSTMLEVTTDIDDAVNLYAVAGVFLAAGQTDTYYIWIQISGPATLTCHDSGLSSGKFVIPYNADGQVDAYAAGKEHAVIGQAMATVDKTAHTGVVRLFRK